MTFRIFPVLLALGISVSTLSGQSKISRTDALADIDTLVSTVERVHFNPYLHVSRQAFDSTVTAVKQSLADSVPFKEFILDLHGITASLHDGHTMPAIVQPALVPELKGNNFLPFRYIFDSTGVYLTKTDYENTGIPHGSRILSVNHVSLNQAGKEFQALLGGSEHFTLEMANRLMGYFLFLKGAIPPFDIAYTTAQGENGTLTLNDGVPFMEMLIKSMPQISGKNEYRIIDNKLACINYMYMDGDFNRWAEFLDSAFTDIESRGIETVCIDVRNNSGGNSLFNNFLLAFITKKKFLQSGGKAWRISPDYKRHQQENGQNNSEYQSKENGSVWTYSDCTPKENLVNVDSIFTGDVFLLTGPFTFSSANMLADAFKTYQLGTIIGEPTGEYTNDFGEVMPFTLPNSKIKIQITTSFEFGADCNRQEFRTVEPDILVVPTLEDQLSGTDAVLEYLLGIRD